MNRLLSTVSPAVLDLAARASLAARVEPALLRALRLRIAPQLDAGTEGDLWFSALVEARGIDGIVLRREILEDLRAQLQADKTRLEAAWALTFRMHSNTSPAIQLEEQIAWLACTAGEASANDIDAALRQAVVALVNEGRRGIATWAMRALPRMPKVARDTTAAWLLALGTARTTGTRPEIGDSPPSDLLDADLQSLIPLSDKAEIGILRNGRRLSLGDPIGPHVKAIVVPDTDPRYVEVRDGDGRRVVPVPAGRTVTIDISAGPISFRTADYRVYELPPEPPVQVVVVSGGLIDSREFELTAALKDRTDLVHVAQGGDVSADAIKSADLVLVLVTPEYSYSSGYDRMERLIIDRAQQGLVRVIPVILEPTSTFKRSPLVRFQMLPRDGKALSEHRNVETARSELINNIFEVAEAIRSERGKVITVASSGTGHYRSISEALEHASTGSTIVVKPGIYREHVRLKPGITLRGEDAETVIIDGGGKGWVVRMANGARMTGCTVRGSGDRSGVNDCGVMVEGCTDVVVAYNRIADNGHYGVVLRRCQCEILHNVIEGNKVLGIYLDSKAEFDIAFNIIANHRHSALDVTGDSVRGKFRHNTVVATESGISEGNGAAPPIEVFDNIFANTKSGISATRGFAAKVRSNLFSGNEYPFFDWRTDRPVRISSNNVEADVRFESDSYRLSPDSPAIGAASDDTDLGALAFVGVRSAKAGNRISKTARVRSVKKTVEKKATQKKIAAKKKLKKKILRKK